MNSIVLAVSEKYNFEKISHLKSTLEALGISADWFAALSHDKGYVLEFPEAASECGDFLITTNEDGSFVELSKNNLLILSVRSNEIFPSENLVNYAARRERSSSDLAEPKNGNNVPAWRKNFVRASIIGSPKSSPQRGRSHSADSGVGAWCTQFPDVNDMNSNGADAKRASTPDCPVK